MLMIKKISEFNEPSKRTSPISKRKSDDRINPISYYDQLDIVYSIFRFMNECDVIRATMSRLETSLFIFAFSPAFIDRSRVRYKQYSRISYRARANDPIGFRYRQNVKVLHGIMERSENDW